MRFTSPLRYSQERFERQAAEYVVPPVCQPEEFQGECHANHIRKQQCSYGWDWSVVTYVQMEVLITIIYIFSFKIRMIFFW